MLQEETEMPSVKYDDLEMAVMFISGGELLDARAYISRKTGEIYWLSDETEEEEEIPTDVDNPDLYAFVPSQRDLDLGKHLVFKFVSRELPDRYEEVDSMFRHSGAYTRYKELLDGIGLLETWYKYEQSALEAAILDWAESEGFSVKGELSAPAT
jgi:hypothetical protein